MTTQSSPRFQRPFELDDLYALLPWVPGARLLDLGCGAGQLSLPLASYGFAIDAVDSNHQALAAGQAAAADLKIRWLEQDIRLFEFETVYAGLLCQNVLPFLAKAEGQELLQKGLAAIQPNGFFIFSTFSAEDPAASGQLASDLTGRPHPTACFDLSEILEMLRGWTIHFSFQGLVADDHAPHGPHQHGLTQVIAQKPAQHDLQPHNWATLPKLGTGMGWRSPLIETLQTPGAVDFIEIMSDDYLDTRYDTFLLQLCQNYAVVLHGVELSIGSSEGIDPEYISDIQRLLQRCQSPWWSDHLCYTQASGYKTYALNPLPLTEVALDCVISNIKDVQKQITTPLLLENVAYYQSIEGAEMSEGTFFKRLCEATDCGILLDVANLFGNSYNLKQDPYTFLAELPVERVVQVHLAGGRMIQNLLFDTHDSPIWQETWSLLKDVLRRFDIKAISLERDSAFETSQDIAQDLAQIRHLLGLRL